MVSTVVAFSFVVYFIVGAATFSVGGTESFSRVFGWYVFRDSTGGAGGAGGDSSGGLVSSAALNDVSIVLVTFGTVQVPLTCSPILFGKGSFHVASFVSFLTAGAGVLDEVEFVSFACWDNYDLFKSTEIGFIEAKKFFSFISFCFIV